MKNQIEKSPILITGCARSGTSMIAGVINICGAYGGTLLGASHYNRKGFFENGEIRETVVKPYLRSHNLDPLGQNPLPETANLTIPNDWRSKIEEIMIRHGYKGGEWFYKGAKSCHLWPIWNYAFPNAKWVIVRRRSSDIADSCLRTSFMRAYTEHEDWIKWVNYHEDRFIEMIQAGLNVKVIWPERLIKGNYEQLYELIEWLNLTWKAEEVMAFIEPKLWKAKQKEGLKI